MKMSSSHVTLFNFHLKVLVQMRKHHEKMWNSHVKNQISCEFMSHDLWGWGKTCKLHILIHARLKKCSNIIFFSHVQVLVHM